MKVTNELLTASDQGLISVLLDLSAASDTAGHHVMLLKNGKVTWVCLKLVCMLMTIPLCLLKFIMELHMV